MQTLASHIARAQGLPAVAAVGWILRLARTLEPLHELGVAHGSLSGDAILTDGPAPGTRGQILVPRQLRGQAAFHSPERCAGEGPSPEDDTWAAAVLLYFALTNAVPFAGADDREVRRSYLNGKPATLASHTAGDDGLQEIMDRALTSSVLDRITSLSALREALEQWHPHPAARELPPLEHEGSLLLSLTPGPGPVETASAPPASAPHPTLSRDVIRSLPRAAAPAPGRPPVIHQDDEEEDAPTRVRDVPLLLEQLTMLQRSEPPAVPSAPPESAELSWRTPVVPAPAAEDAIPSSVPAFVRESSPGNVAVAQGAGHIALDRASSPVLPLVRDSAPGDVPVAERQDLSQPRIELDRPSAPVIPFERESAPPQSRPAPQPTPEVVQSAYPSARPPAIAPAPSLAAAPPPPPKGPPIAAIGVAVAAIAGFAAFFVLRPKSQDTGSATPGVTTTVPATSATDSPSPTPTARETATATAMLPTSEVTATPTPTATLLATVTATATAAATSAPIATAQAASAQEGAGACMASFFATGTFLTTPTGLDAACKVTDPRDGVKLVKLQTILAGENKRVTDGMREWAIIGWYGMPAFEAIRLTCCASPPEMRIPFKDSSCDLESAVKRLAKAASSKSSDETELNDSLKAYTKAVICTSTSGASAVFNQPGSIIEGELVTFQKTLARLRGGASK